MILQCKHCAYNETSIKGTSSEVIFVFNGGGVLLIATSLIGVAFGLRRLHMLKREAGGAAKERP